MLVSKQINVLCVYNSHANIINAKYFDFLFFSGIVFTDFGVINIYYINIPENYPLISAIIFVK